jgi:hypothetical protein
MIKRKIEPKPPKKRERQPSTPPQDSGEGASNENRLDADTDPAIEKLREEMEGTRTTFINALSGVVRSRSDHKFNCRMMSWDRGLNDERESRGHWKNQGSNSFALPTCDGTDFECLVERAVGAGQ